KTARYSPYDNVKTARETRSPAQSLKSARQSPYGLPTARQLTDRSPIMKTARYSPYDSVKTARETRSPAASLKTANGSPYAPRSAAENVNTAVAGGGRSPFQAFSPQAYQHHSLYLTPKMNYGDDAEGRSPSRDYNNNDGDIRTARSVIPRDVTTSPLHPTMTARDVTSGRSPMRTARREEGYGALPNSTVTCLSGRTPGRSSNQPTARSPMMYTSRAPSASPMHTARMDAGAMLTAHTQQSPSAYSSASGRLPSNLMTAQGSRSPHVDTESPSNLKTAREQRPASKSPVSSASQRRAQELLMNTMPTHLSQEDSFSEQSQFTYRKTPNGGLAQKNTHSSGLITGQQRTPTKGEQTQADPTLYYSARQTTPARTLRPGGAQRTPTRVNTTPLKQRQSEVPKCSLRSGCKATHEPRQIPSVVEDSPSTRSAVAAPKTPERSVRTARGLSLTRPMPTPPSAPYADMRTPRTAQLTTSPASSLLNKSPALSSCVRTAMSPDALSNSAVSNADVNTARRVLSDPSRPPLTRSNWMQSGVAAPAADDATAGQTVAAASNPRVIMRANQADGKIQVEVLLSFKLNTTGTIRVRGEMVPQLNPRTVAVNGQQIWSDANRL
ncbi:hypothetical protein PFISCL1PPCAC_25375, partial [Pristionchus fissidentatus]